MRPEDLYDAITIVTVLYLLFAGAYIYGYGHGKKGTMKLTKVVLVVFLMLFSLNIGHTDPLADHVFDLVNLQRAANSLPLLTRASELDLAAQRHSDDMAAKNFFSHAGSNGSNPGQRITAAGYRWTRYGENIAAGWRTAETVMAGWMNSPGHRANILNPNFKEIGIGITYRDGTTYDYYWTQDFGTRSFTPIPPAPTPIPVPPVLVTRPSLVSVQPRIGYSAVSVITLTGNNFDTMRGHGRVTIRRMNTQVYAAVTHRTWANTKITVTFTTPQRGWHYVRVERSDGRVSISALLYVR